MAEKLRTIAAKESTRNEYMLFKIKSKAKNVDAVLQRAIKALKREVKNE